MFNPTQVVIDAFVEQLQEPYEQIYGRLEPDYPGIIGSSHDWQRKILPTVTLRTTT